MTRSLGIPGSLLFGLLLAGAGWAAPASSPAVLVPIEDTSDLVGAEGDPVPAKPLRQTTTAVSDTVWIADWTFDAPGGGCTDAGWLTYDRRILNDGSNYWTIGTAFADTFGIEGQAAILAKHDLCWVRDGYGRNWDYSIVLKYRGSGATLTFDYLLDSEQGFDFLTIEADSAGASESRVDYNINPNIRPEDFRRILFTVYSLSHSTLGPLALPDFGLPSTTHEVYIRFTSDGDFSDEDGRYSSRWHAGLVVDNIVITGTLPYSENFESTLNPNVQLANTKVATPFGNWSRLFPHVTDNDKCNENTTCAWVWTDPTRSPILPDMAFASNMGIIRNWLDNTIVSPWVSLASTPGSQSTLLSFRRFPGNRFQQGTIVQGWAVRGKVRQENTDTPVPGDSIDCVGYWNHTSEYNSLSSFTWETSNFDMTPYPATTAVNEIQLRFQVTDWQYEAGAPAPATLNTGPGPFLDRVRIGRRVRSGPRIAEGNPNGQAQDCFATQQSASVPGEHFVPAADRFGTCALSSVWDTTYFDAVPGLIPGDSITVGVADTRGAGGVTSILWYGAIVSGPHTGKAPAPYTVGANDFFTVQPESCRSRNGYTSGGFFIDLDDTYFRGGDVLQYFWSARDAAGGFATDPEGLTEAPPSVAAAELATGGLLEVNFLPIIDWDPGYLVRIAADDHGDLAPTATELLGSRQRNCILYYQHSVTRRRSGDANRTAFMYALDRLGYRNHYDVYDVQSYTSLTNTQLAGRASLAQMTGYALIIEDDGRSTLTPNIPNGSGTGGEVNQAQWYRDWLASGVTSAAGSAALWILGENTAFEAGSNALFTSDMGLASIANDQSANVNPNVVGVADFTFTNGQAASFTNQAFALNGGCPAIRAYDAAASSGTAVVTHRYAEGTTLGSGAVILNKNSALHWNTIWMGFPWFDVRTQSGMPEAPVTQLLGTILNAALPEGCLQHMDPVDATPDAIDAPRRTVLHPNIPNPFNPTTVIRFDLAHDGVVQVLVFDVAGKLVRTLADKAMQRGFGQSVAWDGLDGQGRRAPSGIYFYRLAAGDGVATRKMLLLK